MNPRTIPASNAALSPVPANERQVPDAGFPGDFQDLCSLAMDQAIGIEKASLATVVTLNTCAIDTYKNFLDTGAQAFVSCMEVQMNWLTLMASHVADTVESISGIQAQLTAEVLERSMDIAIGAQSTALSSMVASISDDQAQPERNMDIAVGARA